MSHRPEWTHKLMDHLTRSGLGISVEECIAQFGKPPGGFTTERRLESLVRNGHLRCERGGKVPRYFVKRADDPSRPPTWRAVGKLGQVPSVFHLASLAP